ADARIEKGWPGLRGGITELAVPLVHKEILWLTVAGSRWDGIYLRIHLSVNGNQIKPAIVIEIDKCGSPLHPGKRYQGDSGVVGDIAEVVLSLVHVEGVVFVGEVGDVERRAARVVVVAYGDTHRTLFGAIGRNSGAGFKTDIAKLAVTFVLVKIIGCGVVGDVDIWLASSVEISPDRA